MRNNRWLPIVILLLLITVGISALVQVLGTSKKSKQATSNLSLQTKPEVGTNASIEITEELMRLGVLRSVDSINKNIVFYNLSTMKEEGYVYNSSTSVKNAFDQETVMKSLALGSILELYFDESGTLKKVLESKEAWKYQGVTNLVIEEGTFLMKIGKKSYTYDAGITIMNGTNTSEIKELLPSKDVLDIRGIGDKILSIAVAKGHGSLDFIGYDDFIGGTIEIGYEVFEDIKENMKYVLREGTYKIIMENGGLLVHKVVDVERDRIRLLDLSKLKEESNKNSRVSFQISPKGTALFVDGKEVDYRKSLELSYGEYIVKATKEGYTDFEDIIRVSKPKEKIKIILATDEDKKETKTEEGGFEEGEESEEEEETSSEEEETSEEEVGNGRREEAVERVDDTKKITFLKPVGATILVDDTVVGVVPCETVKITGEHKITIEKDGFSPVSYTIDIADDGEDVVFSFPELTN